MTRRDLTTRLPVLGLVLAAGALGVYLATRAGGAGAGLLAAVALASTVGLVLWIEPASVDATTLLRLFDAGLLALPGALTVYFAFDSGGYFPLSPAVAAIFLIGVLILRVTLVDEPFAGFSRRLGLAAIGLGGLALWTLVSALWSDAPARALIEFDRTLTYLLVLVVFGSIARTSRRLRFMAGCLALGIVAVAIAALATRLLPDRFPISIPSIGPALEYPLTYSNALGFLCVMGTILSLYFASHVRESPVARVLGTAALPIFATTVYLTLSRGPVAAAFVGIAAFLLLGRPRGLVPALIAAVPASVIAVASAYHHPALTKSAAATPASVSQGHRVALVLALCVGGAALVRFLLTPLDARLASFSLPRRQRRTVLAAAWTVAALAVVAMALAMHAPSRLSDQYHRFLQTAEAGPNQDVRASVFNPSNRGLVDNWSVALKGWKERPFSGQGAGTYEVYWNQHRPAKQAGYNVTDAHSLYAETLSEYGAVGFLLLVSVVVLMLLAFLRINKPHRTLYAALFAVLLAWAVHAGVEWDWEMPAITAGAFALGGAGLASHFNPKSRNWPPQAARVTIGVLLLGAAITPLLIFTSQQQLNAARDALRAGNCTRAIDRGTASISTLSLNPEPYEVVALCQAKAGRYAPAVRAMAEAAKRDPKNSRYAFGLATVQGAAGIPPRPELVKAHELNPHVAEINQLLADVPRGSAAAWDLELAAPAGASAPQP